MRDIASDLRHALRMLITQRSFSLTAILTLALGIGITTSIFSVVNGIVLHPLPFPAADRLVSVCEQYPGATDDWCSISPPNVEDIAARSRSLETIGIARSWPYHLLTVEGNDVVDGGVATPGFFQALGVRPALGRLIQPSDITGQEGTVAVLGWDIWQSRFGGSPSAIGRVVIMDGHPVTIVGVLPRDFKAPLLDWVELWKPLHISPHDESHRDWHGFVAYGRLRPGASLGALSAELGAIAVPIRRAHFATTVGWGFRARQLVDLVIGGVRPILLLFLAGAVLVLLIGCANVANLLLARGSARVRETALRSALGASRARLARALFVESLVLALVGAAAGLVLAAWATAAFKALAPATLPRIDEVQVDARVMTFAITLAVATTLVFGLVPALRSARVDVASSLREGGRGAARAGGRFGKALVIGELALASMLVTGAGLLTRSFAVLSAWQPGFEREHLLTFSVFVPDWARGHIPDFLDRMEAGMRSIPGVTNVGTASAGPLFGGGDGSSEVRLDRGASPAGATMERFDVSPGFFATLGVPFVRGHDLGAAARPGDALEALVNEAAARRFWPDANPVGRLVTVLQENRTFIVVGVVRDVPLIDPMAPPRPQIYWSNRQLPRGFTYVVLRSALPPQTIVSSVRERLRDMDRGLRPGNVNTMTELVARRVRTPRFDMVLFIAFGLAALLLAAIGTYGLFAYTVSQRTREIGIRIALGAPRARVLASVLGEGAVLAGGGIVIGLAGSFIAARTMSAIAVGVSPLDPYTILLSTVVLLLVALVACLVPARRASSVDPVVAFTAE